MRVKKLAKIQHTKAKIMASGPITSRKIEGAKLETAADFLS